MTREEAVARIKDHIEIHRCHERNAVKIFEALDMAINALEQPEPSTEIQEILNYLDTTLHPIVSPDNWYVYAELYDMVSKLPSAQPEKRTEERTETHSCDCISRQAAIDALKDRYYKYDRFAKLEELVWVLEQLPSAQPETAKRIVGKSRGGMTLWYQCDTCNEPVDAQDNFCRGCGRRLTDG